MIIIDVVFCVALFRLFVPKFRYFELRLASFRHFACRFFVISSFCVASFRYFVFSRGVFSLLRYFALRYFVISSFRVALFRYFFILRGVISWQKDEKTKWHKSATILRESSKKINTTCNFVIQKSPIITYTKY